jgi:hypothetical protein
VGIQQGYLEFLSFIGFDRPFPVVHQFTHEIIDHLGRLWFLPVLARKKLLADSPRTAADMLI